MVEKKRSKGVTIFAWIDIVVGILGILAFLSRAPTIMLGSPLVLITGIGLLRLKEWARKLTIILSVFGVLFRVVIYLIGVCRYSMQLNEASIYIIKGNLLTWVWAAIYIYFFTRLQVKEQFKKEKVPNA